MADEVQELGLDARNFEEGIDAVAEALKKYSISVEDAVDASAKFSRQGELLSATVTKVDKDGTKIVQTFGEVKNQLLAVAGQFENTKNKYLDLQGAITNSPVSFGLQSTKVVGKDPASNAAAFEQQKLQGALRAQQAEDAISKQRLAKQEAEAKLRQDLYDQQINAYTEFNKKKAAEDKKALEQQDAFNKKQNDLLIKSAINTAKARAEEAKAAAQPSAFRQGLSSFANRTASIVTSQAIIGTVNAIQGSVSDSLRFSEQLAQIGTISQDSATSLEKYRQGIIDVSNAYGIAREDVASGVYETLSNQIAKGNDAIVFQAEAAKLARTAVSSQAEAVNALSSVINSYGFNVNKAAEISAVLFKGVDLGRFQLRDIANTLGTVTVAASQLGVTYQEVVASLSLLTQKGFTAANAQTSLANFLNQLIKPTEATTEALKKYGFESGQAAVRALGFTGVLKLLTKEADGNVSKFGEFATNIRSLRFILGTAGQGTQGFVNILDQLTESQNTYNEAQKFFVDQTFTSFKQLRSTLDNTFLSIGDTITNSIVKLVNSLGGINQIISGVTAGVFGLGSAFGILAVAQIPTMVTALVTLTRTLTGFNLALVASPVGLFAVAIGAAVALIVKAQEDTRQIQREAERIDQETIQMISRIRQKQTEAIRKSVDEEVALVSKAVAAEIVEYNKLEDSAVESFKRIKDQNQSLGNALIQQQRKVIKDLANEERRNADQIKKFKTDLAEAELAQQNKTFERQLENSTIQLQLTERQLEKQRLLIQAEDLGAQGKFEEAEKSISLAAKQEDAIEKLEGKIRSVNSEFLAFIRNSVTEEFAVQEKIVDLTSNRINKAFTKLQKSLKDVFDRTGDRTGDSGAFLKTFVKELEIAGARTDSAANRLRRNLERLQSRGKATVLDPQTQDLLNSLDSKTVRELKFRIRIGDQESVSRILDRLREQRQLQDEATKKNIADAQAQRLVEEANAAFKRNDFETERKFLQEAKELRLKGVEDPLQAQAILNQFNENIFNTFKNQNTVQAKILEDQRAGLATAKEQVEQNKATNELLRARETLLKQIEEREANAKTTRDAEIALQRQNLVTLETAFKALNAIKIDKNNPASDALKQFDKAKKDFDAILTQTAQSPTDFVIATQAAADIRKALEKEIATIQQANEIELAKKKSQDIANQVEQEGKLRIALLEKLNLAETKLAQEKIQVETQLKEAQTNQTNQLQIEDPVDPIAQKDFFDNNTKFIDDAQQKLVQLAAQTDRVNKLRKVFTDASTNPERKDEILSQLNGPELASALQLLSGINTPLEISQKTINEIFTNSTKRVKELFVEVKNVSDKVEEPLVLTMDTLDPTAKIRELREADAEMRKQLEAPIKVGGGNVDGEGANIEGFARGGIVGGKSGNDANLIRATKGEFIVNPRSAKAFKNQLFQINAGTSPVNTRNTSVNMGGISINLQATGDARVDARTLGAELTRLAKLGILKG